MGYKGFPEGKYVSCPFCSSLIFTPYPDRAHEFMKGWWKLMRFQRRKERKELGIKTCARA